MFKCLSNDEYLKLFKTCNEKNIKKYVKRLMKECKISHLHKHKLINKIQSLVSYSNNIIELNNLMFDDSSKEVKEFNRRVKKFIDCIDDEYELDSLDSDECFGDDVIKKIKKLKEDCCDELIRDISNGSFSNIISNALNNIHKK